MADTANASVVVKFRAEGVEETKRAIASLAAEGARSDTARARASRTSVSEQQRAERGITRTQAQEARQRTRESEVSARAQAKAARDQQRAAEASARAQTKVIVEQERKAAEEAKKKAKEVSDAKKKELREVAGAMKTFFDGVQAQEEAAEARAKENAKRARQRTIDRRMYVGGALLAGVGAATAMAQQAQGTLGIRSQQEVLSSSIDLRQELIRQTTPAGVSREQRDQLFAGAVDIGTRTGVGGEAVLRGLMMAQERFSSIGDAAEQGESGIRGLMDNMEFFAKVTRATGATFEDVVGAAGEFGRQMDLSVEEQREALAILSQGAQAGSLSLRDFSSSFPQAIASFKGARGISGIAAVREFQAGAQGLRAGGLEADVARTRMQALFSNLSDRNVQRRLRGAGVDVLDRTGNIRSLAELIPQIANNARLRTDTQRRRVFGDQEAMQAIAILSDQERRDQAGVRGAMSLRERQDVSSAEGRRGLDDTFAELNADASGRAMRMRAEREGAVLGDSERLINAMADMAGPLTSLQDSFPRVAMALEGLMPVLQAIAPSLATLAAVKAGGTVAAGLGAGTVVAGTGTAGGVAGVGAGIGGASLGGALTATGIGAVVVAGAGGVYLTRQEQERAAAERRANMGAADGDFADFSTGAISTRDLLVRGAQRRQADQAALPSFGPGGWQLGGGGAAPSGGPPGAGEERIVDATRDQTRELTRGFDALRVELRNLRPPNNGDNTSSGQRR